MISNYMDYSVPCFATFTPDQAARVETILNEAPRRKELLNSTVCESPPSLTFPDVYPCFIIPFLDVPNIGIVVDFCNPTDFIVPPSVAGIYLSPVSPNPTPWYFLDEIDLPLINPQEELSGWQWGIDLSQFPDIPAGDYLLMVVADHANQITESDEFNNQATTTAAFNYLGNGCDNVTEVECGELNTFAHSSNNFPNYWEVYDCTSFLETGAERIFSFETTQVGDVTINLTNINTDIGASWAYLMNFCNPGIGSCLEDGTNFTMSNLAPGKYYIAVEEYLGFDSQFILEVTCESTPLPCSADFSYFCDDYTQFNMSNFTTDRNNIYTCANFDESAGIENIYYGPEVIHEYSTNSTEDIAFTVIGDGMVVFLVDNCDDNNCLAFAEDGEFVFYPSLPAGNYLLIVEQTNPLNQDYGLYLTCNYQQSGICPEILNLEHGPIPSGTYLADKVINATVEINSNETVTFKAGDEINLTAAYEVGLGSTFTTDIEACQQPSFTDLHKERQ